MSNNVLDFEARRIERARMALFDAVIERAFKSARDDANASMLPALKIFRQHHINPRVHITPSRDKLISLYQDIHRHGMAGEPWAIALLDAAHHEQANDHREI
jgi:hypothetical protein